MASDREFDWNDAKAASNLAKHGVPFPYAARAFLDPGAVDFDASQPGDGETRRKVVGMIEGRLFTVVYTEREGVTRGSSPRAAAIARKEGSMVRFKLDPNNLPSLTGEERARLDAMTDADITAAAKADADNPPLTADEAARMEAASMVRRVRARTGLSQDRFAKRYHISVGRLRDLEQGRSKADSALLAYLAVIDREPEAVKRALG
jgi:putative transcriptional regulator